MTFIFFILGAESYIHESAFKLCSTSAFIKLEPNVAVWLQHLQIFKRIIVFSSSVK